MDVTASQLSDNLVQHIFSFLRLKDLLTSRCVCKRWKEVALRKEFWETCHIYIDGNDYSRTDYQALEVSPGLLQSLTIKYVGRAEFARIVQRVIDRNLQGIRKIEIFGCYTYEQDVSRLLHFVAHTLEELDFDGSDMIGLKGASPLLIRDLPKLKKLKTDFPCSAKGPFKALKGTYAQLEELHIPTLLYIRRANSLGRLVSSHKFLNKVKKQIKTLTIGLSDMALLKDDLEFRDNFPALECLNYVFRDMGRSYFYWKLKPQVRLEIHLQSFWPDLMEDYCELLQGLESFSSVEILKFSFSELALSFVFTFLMSFANLKRLSLVFRCSSWKHQPDSPCKDVSDKGYELAVKALSNLSALEFLSMQGCPNFLRRDIAPLKVAFPDVEMQFGAREDLDFVFFEKTGF